MIVEYI